MACVCVSTCGREPASRARRSAQAKLQEVQQAGTVVLRERDEERRRERQAAEQAAQAAADELTALELRCQVLVMATCLGKPHKPADSPHG